MPPFLAKILNGCYLGKEIVWASSTCISSMLVEALHDKIAGKYNNVKILVRVSM